MKNRFGNPHAIEEARQRMRDLESLFRRYSHKAHVGCFEDDDPRYLRFKRRIDSDTLDSMEYRGFICTKRRPYGLWSVSAYYSTDGKNDIPEHLSGEYSKRERLIIEIDNYLEQGEQGA